MPEPYPIELVRAIEQSIIKSSELNNRHVLSLFEVHGKSGIIEGELREKIIDYLLKNYRSFNFNQLGQIVHCLKIKDDTDTLSKLSDSVISNEELLKEPLLLKEMLRIINQ